MFEKWLIMGPLNDNFDTCRFVDAEYGPSFEAVTILKAAHLKMIEVDVKENFWSRYTVITD